MKNKLLVLLAGIVLLSCSREEDEAPSSQKFPDMIQYSYEHHIFKNGRKYLISFINEAHFYDKKKQIRCIKLHTKVYNSDGEETTIIDSDEGLINNKDKIVDFTGNVVITMKDKEVTLYTESLQLMYKDNKLVSETDVVIEKEDGSILKASSMESDIETETTNFTSMDVDYFYDEDKEGGND